MPTTATHTPGPWRNSGIPETYGKIAIVADGPKLICIVKRDGESSEANAKLIEQAPKLAADNAALLAALKAVSGDMAEALDSMPVGEMQRGVWQAGLELARAAIEQATA